MAKTTPQVNQEGKKELEQVESQFTRMHEEIKDMTHDKLNATPKSEVEPQTKISAQEIDKQNELYLKPVRAVPSAEKFNEKFREGWNYDKQYVNFIAENREVVGEEIELWTKPYPGIPAEFWRVPVNKPLWAPRHVAEQIKRCSYHIMTMDQSRITSSDQLGTKYYGSMAVEKTVNRLDAFPVTSNRSVFMGKRNF